MERDGKGRVGVFPVGKRTKMRKIMHVPSEKSRKKLGLMFQSFLINKDEYIEKIFGQQRVRLYIIAGVRDDTAFAPQTKKEISEITWQRLDELQPASDDVISHGVTGLKLYMVAPFLVLLKKWITAHKPPIAPKPDMPLKGICVWKAKNNSIGSNTIILESLLSKLASDSKPPDSGPGEKFQEL